MAQTMEQSYQKLARGYLQKSLCQQEQLTVYNLIIEDPTFRSILKEEVTILQQMRQIKPQLPKALKQKIRRDLAGCYPPPVNLAAEIFTLVLQYTMPLLVSPLINLQRRVFQ